MLVLPLGLGFLAAGRWTVAAGLIVPGTVFLFLGRFASIAGGTRMAHLDARRIAWTAAYFAVSASFLAGAVALSERAQRSDAMVLALIMGLLGALNAGLVFVGWGRRLIAEVLAMAAVATSAPLVLVLTGETLDPEAIGAGLLCLAYFLSTLVFVRAHRDLRVGSARARTIAVCLAAHGALVAGLIALAGVGALPPAALGSFAPPLVRTVTGLAWPARNLRVLGWREVAVASLFLIVAGGVL